MKIEELDFITPRKAKQFQNKGIETVEDLLKLVPKRYLDCRNAVKITKDVVGKEICIIGKIISGLKVIGKNRNIFQFYMTDGANNRLNVVWFNQLFMYEKLNTFNVGQQVLVLGKLSYNEEYSNFTISNPRIFTDKIEENKKIVPVYKKISGMSDEYYKDAIEQALSIIRANDYLSGAIREEFELCEYNKDFFMKIHKPKNKEDIEDAQRRMIFDDLFYFASKLLQERCGSHNSDFLINKTDIMNEIISALPYSLTDDQCKTVEQIVNKAKEGERINALIQGDVGCGKTIVSFLSMVAFAENGYQTVIMAPTQVLAKQHFEGLKNLLKNYDFDIAYLHSGMKAKEKREIFAGIKEGKYKFVVGTHSVFSSAIEYNKLALVITDEEHKFGVAQRDALTEKASVGVHTITMSATPIPRTMALTLYGEDKEVFTIKQMPNGRKKVITGIALSDEKVFSFMEKSIMDGRQCYVVCPLIKDSDSEKMEGVESVVTVYEKLADYYSNNKNIKIGVLTGKQNNEEIEQTIKDFQDNKIQILISTTVIEVGVNVPNASIIVIRNAERFGLAQLHQLRGRVGRGSYQSYCVLCSDKKDNERLNVMCNTSDGFELAKADLFQRGMGDLIGTKQSGDNKYVELMLLYPNFYEKIKNKVKYLIEQSNMLR